MSRTGGIPVVHGREEVKNRVDAQRFYCQMCTVAPAVEVVEWRIPDPHSVPGEEFFGPYLVMTCGDAGCQADAVAQATDEGADDVDLYPVTARDLAALCA